MLINFNSINYVITKYGKEMPIFTVYCVFIKNSSDLHLFIHLINHVGFVEVLNFMLI